VKEAVRLKKEAFRAWFDQGSPKTADRYREARRAAASAVTEANTRVGGVRGGHGEGFSVGLKEVLANRLATQEWKAGLGSGCAQWGRRTADPD